jgi:DNA-binding SARP family transcriptional activator
LTEREATLTLGGVEAAGFPHLDRGQLKVALLGPPRVEVAGAPLRVDTRKAVALLAYLASTGRRHGRDQLAALLWPDADDAHARAALRRTLSALNHALGAAARVGGDRAGLELVAPAMDLDVRRFRQLVAFCDAHGHGPEQACGACAGPLEAAVALHRGDFLAGFVLRDAPEFEDWQLAEVEALRREQAGALQRLVDADAVLGRWQAAIAGAERWLGLDSLHEPAHRQLMRLYAWSGQRGAAMRQYRACVRVLDEELGVPPLEETTALYQAVMEGRVEPPPASAPPPDAVTPGSAPAREPAPAIAGVAPEEPDRPDGPAPVPLVGRQRQWGALLEAWDGVRRAGKGRLVVLTGEAGIGKTRLAEDFAAHLRQEGGKALLCRCYEGERVAYGPLADGLRSIMAGPDGEGWAKELEAHWLAEVARLLPELSPLVPPSVVSEAADGPGAQGRFLEGLCRALLAAVRGAQPGLLMLDDLQWADDATLDAIGYLARRLDRAPVLVLAAWPGEHVPRGHRLRGLVAEAHRAGTATSLELARLDRASVAELVRAVAPDHAQAADELYQRTEGLPLLVVEYLAALDGDDGPLPALPSGARELLQARIERVSAPAWQLLGAAAVIGRSFDVDTVQKASGRSDEEAIGAIEELVRLGMIHELDGPATSYDFTHEQVRLLVYEQAGLARRRLLHRRVAQALVGRVRGEATASQAASISRHFQLAGRDTEAAEWFARAGASAAALYANREAVAHYQAALALGHPEVGRLQLALGDLHTLLGSYGDALAAYEAAAAHSDPDELAFVEHKLGSLHHRRGDWEAAEAHLEAALAALGGEAEPGPSGQRSATGVDPLAAERARLLADRSLVAHRRGRAEQAEELAARALGLAEAAGDEAALAQCHNLVGMLATSAGDHQRASEHLEQSLAHAGKLHDPGARVAALNNLALVHRAAGRLDLALELTSSALDLCAAQGDRHRQAALFNNLADLLHADGRREEAMAHLKQAVTIFAEVGEPDRLQPAIWKLVEW